MKAELAEAKAQKASLEERIQKLQSIRMELELMFDNEKTSLLKQQERDRETVGSNNRNRTFFSTYILQLIEQTNISISVSSQ
jgi:hypothetical protein